MYKYSIYTGLLERIRFLTKLANEAKVLLCKINLMNKI